MTRRLLPRTSAAFGAAGALLVLYATSSAEPNGRAAPFGRDWFDEMDGYYAAHRELTQPGQIGSGWEAYSHLKRFYEARLHDGELPPSGARQHATDVRNERLRGASVGGGWWSVGPWNFAGRMLAIAFDPTSSNTVYGGAADGGVWKSTDGGTSWAPMSDELPSLAVGGIAVAPSDPNIVVIGTGEPTINIDRVSGVGILRSTDAGASWNPTSLSYAVSDGHGFHFVTANPLTGTMLAGATDGMYRSTDDGATWTQVRTGASWYDAVWRPGDASVCYAVRGDSFSLSGVKKSTDDGVTWNNAGPGQPAANVIGKSKLAVTPANPDYLYVIYNSSSTSGATVGVYRSTDAGGTFTARNTTTNVGGGQGWYNLSLAADPSDSEAMITGGVHLYRSTDGGTTLTVKGLGVVHDGHHAIAYAAGSPSELWVGTDGGFWKSTDAGASWPASGGRNDGLVTSQFYDLCLRRDNVLPYYLLGGTQGNGVDRSDGSPIWTDTWDGFGVMCSIDRGDGTTAYIAAGAQPVKNTTSGTGVWVPCGVVPGSAVWNPPLAEDEGFGDRLYTSTSSGVFRTTDGCASWVPVDASPATWISISPLDGEVAWALGAQVRYTTDGGATWQSASPYGFPTGVATRIVATEAGGVFVTFGGYVDVSHIALSSDQGATWTDVTGDLPPQPVNTIAVNPSSPAQWFIGTDTGVWISEDGGAHWAPFGASLPNAVVVDLEILAQAQMIVAGTHGRGVWQSGIPEGPGDVDLSEGSTPPALRLDEPFPNPVTDRTTLRYAARSTSKASLAIYDVRGRLVSDLAGAALADGILRTAPWDASDVPNGVYFAVLKAGKETVARKLVVAK